MVMETISVYQYVDCRQYLKDYFEERKKNDPKFSHRYLSRRLGLKSPNFIMMVMQGKRNLTNALAFRITEEFKLDKKESEYFECMVSFTQTERIIEKDRYFIRMMELRCKSDVSRIEECQYEYYSTWYNPVIRELVTSADFKEDFKRLAAEIHPSITEAMVKHSVDLLLKLGLLRKVETNYVQNSALISTGPQVSSLAIANYHRIMAQKAADAIDLVPKEERDMTACTINLSSEGFEKTRKVISECRRKIMEIAEVETTIHRIYQVNFQLFPVTDRNKTKKKKE
jgi:uncharacterized protein (TIGR02147 family)